MPSIPSDYSQLNWMRKNGKISYCWWYLPNHSFVSTEVNECESSPCQNEGMCLDKFGGYTCDCLAGWYGVNCEMGEFFAVFVFTGFNNSVESKMSFLMY